MRPVAGPCVRSVPAGAPHRALFAVGVLHLPPEEPAVLLQLVGELLSGLVAVVDLDEQQRHLVLRGGQDEVGLGAALAGRVPRPGGGQRDLGPVRGDAADPSGCIDGGLGSCPDFGRILGELGQVRLRAQPYFSANARRECAGSRRLSLRIFANSSTRDEPTPASRHHRVPNDTASDMAMLLTPGGATSRSHPGAQRSAYRHLTPHTRLAHRKALQPRNPTPTTVRPRNPRKDQKCRSGDRGTGRGVPPHDSYAHCRYRPTTVTLLYLNAQPAKQPQPDTPSLTPIHRHQPGTSHHDDLWLRKSCQGHFSSYTDTSGAAPHPSG